MRKDFAAFILTHARAEKVVTYKTLRDAGYTGRIILIVDDTDPQIDDYKSRFEEVHVFDKAAIAATTDNGDNFQKYCTGTHARNAITELAPTLGLAAYVMLDDDYTSFAYKFNGAWKFGEWMIRKNLDLIFSAMVEFLEASPSLSCICFAQGGDYIGGKDSGFADRIKTKRKAMNSFFCLTARPFKFLSRLNEDVNTCLSLGGRGKIFLTINHIMLHQLQTQTNTGGMSEAYLDHGTYIKSFFSIMYRPDCVRIGAMGTANQRIHHKVNWRNAVPKILREG